MYVEYMNIQKIKWTTDPQIICYYMILQYDINMNENYTGFVENMILNIWIFYISIYSF